MEEKIQEIEETFDLVMISEQFEKGIILLKRALCWSNEDMAYISPRVGSKSNISEAAEKRLKFWLRSDFTLYKYFKDKFKKEITHQTQQFMTTEIEVEAEILAGTNRRMYDACRVRRHKTPHSFFWGLSYFGRNVYQGPNSIGIVLA